jgi:ketosteroid isomerase-like protein
MDDLGKSARPVIESFICQHLAAWEAADAGAISATLHPDVEFVFPAIHWRGQNRVRSALAPWLVEWRTIRIHARHMLVDVDRRVAAVMWVGHFARPGESGSQELLGGTALDFDQDGLIGRWRTYLDPVRQRTLPDFEASWPAEGWSPCPNPGPPPTPTEIEQIIRANAQAWSSHNLAQLQAIIHDDIVLQPPWDYLAGRTALEAGARVYFANYRDTQVTPRRLILDATQPYFGVCEQTFACTNPDTGQRGEDHDFAFFEIAQGKLRYWRTYFDTSRSAQVVEKTLGFQSH